VSAEPGKEGVAASGQADGVVYRVDARGAAGVQVGDQATQINYFYQGTWTDGVAPPPLVDVSGEIRSPYRGLRRFGERDAALFFGRESAATTVLELMSRRLEGAGLLVVSGVSGAGKSSLLRAGVLPRLRGAGLASAPEAARWPCLVFTPTRRPLDELAVRVAQVIGADAGALRRGLAADPGSFALYARQASLARMGGPAEEAGLPENADQRLLLVVDQFEQLFTQCDVARERQAFIAALHAAATAGQGDQQLPAGLVVLVVRADFEARLADYPLLVPAVQDRYLLTSMTERQLRIAITQPAVVAGSGVDSELVAALLEEVRAHAGSPAADSGGAVIGAGVLPLLSHALDKAWRGRTGQMLTLADYERTGGIHGAVAESAQQAYERLTPAQQIAARQVFTRLTATNSDGLDTTTRVARGDLTADEDEARTRDVEAVLETFVAERLLTAAAGTVEISHEAVLTAWPLLRDTWLADTHADRIVRTRLQTTAEEWIRASRDSSYLYGGSRLEAALDAAARIGADAHQTPLSRDESEFLDASRRADRRKVRRRQAFTATLLVLVISLAAAAVTAIRASNASTRQRDIATSRLLASGSEVLGAADATGSQLESIAAWGVYPTDQAYYSMLAAAADPEIATFKGTGAVQLVAFSPDGKTLASVGDDGKTALWNLITGQQTGSLPAGGSGAAHSAAFSPDGKILAIGGSDGKTALWNLVTGRRTGSLPAVGEFNSAFSVAFSPDGKVLATGGFDGTTWLWDLSTGKRIRSFNTGSFNLNRDSLDKTIESVAFSMDGKTLATGGADGKARLWNLATGQQIRSIPEPGGVFSMAFSPDGKTLATGDALGARLWNLATGQQIAHLVTNSFVWSVAFSRDGKIVVTGSKDGTARLWDTANGQQVGSSLLGGTDAVSSVAFSPDGKTLATGDADGTARLWKLSTEVPVYAGPADRSSGTWSVAFSHDGKTLAVGGIDGTRLWNLATGQQIRFLRASDGVLSVAFSRDGKTLATGGSDGAGLWDLSTGQRIRRLASGVGGVDSVAFSPDGKTLATGDQDGTARLWNPATGQQIRSITAARAPNVFTPVTVTSVAFSPDGKTLATGDADGTARLWNLATGQQIGSQFHGSSGSVESAAFSQDGKTLATGDGDGTARLWNLATGQQIGSPLPGGTSAVGSVAFSPDGKTLATGDRDGTARLWNLATGQQIGSQFHGSSGWVASVAFSPDGTTLATSDEYGPAQVWDASYLTDVLARLCSQVGGSLTPAEWARYVPPGPAYRKVCP
jgi:WD40 repeat protein